MGGGEGGRERKRERGFTCFLSDVAKKQTRRCKMASPAPSPRGPPPTLNDRLSEPLDEPLSSLNPQTTASNVPASGRSSEQEEQRASPMLLSFAPAAVAAIVSPLPPRVASRWSSEGGPRPLSGGPLATRDSLDAKLASAEAKRQASFEGREMIRNSFLSLSSLL